MQLYAVNFIPLLGSLYMFRVFYTPIIRSTIFNLSTATGTNYCIISATYSQHGLQATLGYAAITLTTLISTRTLVPDM